MTRAIRFDVATHTIGLDADLNASLVPERPDPPVPVDGMTFGVATMYENAPHDGEMHPDGDEVLYLVSGLARITLETEPVQELTLGPGDGVIVPRGVWHRVDVLEPIQVVYLTPGPNNRFRPLRR